MDVLTTPFLTGTATGAILLLAALGLTLTFGQMGVINMANGEFLMVGAYVAYMTQQVISGAGVSIVVALPMETPAPVFWGRALGAPVSPSGARPRWRHRRRSPGAAPRGHRHPMDVQTTARHTAGDGRCVVGAP